MSVEIKIVCIKCKLETQLEDSIPNSSKNEMVRICKCCVSTDNHRKYAARSDPTVNARYGALKPDQKVEYYRVERGRVDQHRREYGTGSTLDSTIVDMKGGADIYALTPKRWNALHFAAFNGERETCR